MNKPKESIMSTLYDLDLQCKRIEESLKHLETAKKDNQRQKVESEAKKVTSENIERGVSTLPASTNIPISPAPVISASLRGASAQILREQYYRSRGGSTMGSGALGRSSGNLDGRSGHRRQLKGPSLKQVKNLVPRQDEDSNEAT